MKIRFVLFLISLGVLTAVAACDIVNGSFLAQADPTATAVRNVLATRRVIPPTAPPLPVIATATPQLIPTLWLSPTESVRPSPAIMATVPAPDNFCCLRFAPGPFAQERDTFPGGTEIVYAIWDYTAVAQDDRIRRIWIRDDLIWLAREERWDWEKYGAEGTVRDLSIFDFEGSGLEPAHYRLQLYLNDELQQEAAFTILPP